MMDYFALLGVERRPDLTEEELRTRYHELTRLHHPDQASDAEERERRVRASTDYNRAWDTLRRPVSRLRHLLELTAPGESREVALGEDLMDLFGRIGAQLRETDILLQKRSEATSPLGKALLSDGLLGQQRKLQNRLREVNAMLEARFDKLGMLDATRIDAVKQLYGEMSFLDKWRAQLQERILAIMMEG